jgi:hypothetical protein
MACFVHGTTDLGVQQLINLISFHSSKFSFRICYMLLFMRCGVTMKRRATLTHDNILRSVFTSSDVLYSQDTKGRHHKRNRCQVKDGLKYQLTSGSTSLTHQSRTQTPLPSSFDISHRNDLLLLPLNAVHIRHFQTPIHAVSLAMTAPNPRTLLLPLNTDITPIRDSVECNVQNLTAKFFLSAPLEELIPARYLKLARQTREITSLVPSL